MALTFILHEATRTGAPRLGGLIARELARNEEVRVIVMKDGPLTPWLRDMLGEENLFVCRDDPFHHRVAFEERLRLAADMLEGDPADLVYVNSLASSVFGLAAAMTKRRTLLHVHEKSADMFNLLAHTVTKIEVMRAADAALLAAAEIRADIVEVFKALPPRVETLGIAVDIEAIRRAGDEPVAVSPVNVRGRAFRRGERLVVGMSGHASARKGVDIFFDTAAALPDYDFLWVGGFSPQDTADNIVFDECLRRALPNLYVAGPVENPFPLMRQMDLFFLSSREDPNPLVLAEAMALDVPILVFSHSTAIADRLGRSAVLCHGRPNAPDAIRIIGACTAQALRRPGFRKVGEATLREYDLVSKMGQIKDLIAGLRGRTPTAFVPPVGGVKREMGQGVVELSFS